MYYFDKDAQMDAEDEFLRNITKDFCPVNGRHEFTVTKFETIRCIHCNEIKKIEDYQEGEKREKITNKALNFKSD